MCCLVNKFLLSVFFLTIFGLLFSSQALAQTNQASDFNISIEPANIVVSPGESTNFSITVNSATVNDVKLSLLTLPPFDIVLGNKINSTTNSIKPLLVKVPIDSQPGTYNIVIEAILGGVSHMAIAKLSVISGFPKIPALLLSVPFDNTIIISGTSFNPATRVFINGHDFTTNTTINDSSIVIKGTKTDLAIVRGQNVLELKIDAITTNVFTFRLGTRK